MWVDAVVDVVSCSGRTIPLRRSLAYMSYVRLEEQCQRKDGEHWMAVTCLPRQMGVIQSLVVGASSLGVRQEDRPAGVYHCVRMVDRSVETLLDPFRSVEVLPDAARREVSGSVVGWVIVRLDLAFQILEVHPVVFVLQECFPSWSSCTWIACSGTKSLPTSREIKHG